ncbi:MAG: NAD kinase [Bacteroidales bacterium]|nr:NAD kinase [Bacteroidales bacterium]MCF8389704.1 NAD kinase [Bacteroidales bacterium]
MRIGLYGKEFSKDFNDSIHEMFGLFSEYKSEIVIHNKFKGILGCVGVSGLESFEVFDDNSDLSSDIDILISLGGDGTFLDTVRFVRDLDIPILGINTGRLGFLANISRDEISESVKLLLEGKYTTEERALISLTTSEGPLNGFSKALNEITVHKKYAGMISIDTYLNEEFLNSYWADGLIISTPTGSTAYSMAVGGPIVLPQSRNFIISPVSPHNLTVRPIVVPDDVVIELKVNSRSDTFLVAMDSRSYTLDTRVRLKIEKAQHGILMVKFPVNNFYNTLRNKLMWGMDRRNW